MTKAAFYVESYSSNRIFAYMKGVTSLPHSMFSGEWAYLRNSQYISKQEWDKRYVEN